MNLGERKKCPYCGYLFYNLGRKQVKCLECDEELNLKNEKLMYGLTTGAPAAQIVDPEEVDAQETPDPDVTPEETYEEDAELEVNPLAREGISDYDISMNTHES